MFRVGQPLNVDIMECFPSPLSCHLQHRFILQSNANSATTQQKQGWQEEGMLKTDFNKSCYKTLRPVHKGELRSHSTLWRWELGSPDEVQSLELSFAVRHYDLTIQIHSAALFSFLSFCILPSLLTHQYSVCLPQSCICLHHWKHIIFIPDPDNTFTNICFTETKKSKVEPQNTVRENTLITKYNIPSNQSEVPMK